MRTLFEIIESAKNGQKPEHDECYYAMLVLSHLRIMDGQDMLKVYQHFEDEKQPFGLKFRAEESFNRSKKAMNTAPKDYLGWSYDPANPEYQKQRKLANELFDKIEKKAKGDG